MNRQQRARLNADDSNEYACRGLRRGRAHLEPSQKAAPAAFPAPDCLRLGMPWRSCRRDSTSPGQPACPAAGWYQLAPRWQRTLSGRFAAEIRCQNAWRKPSKLLSVIYTVSPAMSNVRLSNRLQACPCLGKGNTGSSLDSRSYKRCCVGIFTGRELINEAMDDSSRVHYRRNRPDQYVRCYAAGCRLQESLETHYLRFICSRSASSWRWCRRATVTHCQHDVVSNISRHLPNAS